MKESVAKERNFSEADRLRDALRELGPTRRLRRKRS